jgi:predicted aconitase with swiveling domain
MTWAALAAGAACCYLFKLGGLSVPERVLRDPRTRRVGLLLPGATLAALALTQTATTGSAIVLDARAAGVAVAVAALVLRAPFLVVIAAAVLTTAVLRAVT